MCLVLGNELLYQKRHSQTEAALNHAIEILLGTRMVWLGLGIIHAAQGQPELSRKELVSAVRDEEFPDEPPDPLLLALAEIATPDNIDPRLVRWHMENTPRVREDAGDARQENGSEGEW